MKRLIVYATGFFLMTMSFPASAKADLKDMYLGSVFALVQSFATNMQGGCGLGETKNGCTNNAPAVKKTTETGNRDYTPAKTMTSKPGLDYSSIFSNVVNDIVNSYNTAYDVDLDPNDPFWFK